MKKPSLYETVFYAWTQEQSQLIAAYRRNFSAAMSLFAGRHLGWQLFSYGQNVIES